MKFKNDFDIQREKYLENWAIERFGREGQKMNQGQFGPLVSEIKQKLSERKVKIVTIAGTNGKGEVAHSLHELIRSHGLQVALWTSPHILSLRERFYYPEGLASYDFLEQSFKNFEEVAKKNSLSYFEFLFYIFLKGVLDLKEIDLLILEVGLGGRLDAANFFDADIMAVTSISLDHQEFLGNSLSEILIEKLGITRPHRPLIFSLEQETLRSEAKKYCLDKEIPFQDLFSDQLVLSSMHYAKRNQILARTLFEKLYGEKAHHFKRENFHIFKGRREEWKIKGKSWTFIGGHNPDGIDKMLQFLNNEGLSFDHLILAFSKRDLEAVYEMISSVKKNSHLFTQVQIVNFEHAKSMSLSYKDLTPWIQEKHFIFAGDAKEFLTQKILKDESYASILVSGSYYFIGEVQKILLGH